VSVADSDGLNNYGCLSSSQTHSPTEQLEEVHATLGPRFIADGDYNAKHTDWGSRIITPQGREVLKTMESNNLAHLSMGQPTYWASDTNNIPDLVDFCITKGIPSDFAVAQSCLDLSSNHSPVFVTLTSHAINQDKQPSLSNRSTNWDYFSHLIHQQLILQVPLKTTTDIEAAVKFFNGNGSAGSCKATPKLPTACRIHGCPITIQQKLAEKRKLRRDWHRFRTPESKRLLNAATQDQKQLLRRIKNDRVQTLLQGLQPTASTDCSLWKATKNLKRITTFATASDISRNLGEQQHRQATRFR
jgi:hypothetical protein